MIGNLNVKLMEKDGLGVGRHTDRRFVVFHPLVIVDIFFEHITNLKVSQISADGQHAGNQSDHIQLAVNSGVVFWMYVTSVKKGIAI